MSKAFLSVLALWIVSVVAAADASSLRRIFGIGIYNDTPGSPPVIDQVEVAFNLTGPSGFVLFFFETFDPSNPSSLLPQQWQIDAINLAYTLGLQVVIRMGQAARDYRYYSDDPQHLHYTRLASQYASFIGSLPLPPTTTDPLFVGVGNEFNIFGEWRCTEGAGVFMNVSQVITPYMGRLYPDSYAWM